MVGLKGHFHSFNSFICELLNTDYGRIERITKRHITSQKTQLNTDYGRIERRDGAFGEEVCGENKLNTDYGRIERKDSLTLVY